MFLFHGRPHRLTVVLLSLLVSSQAFCLPRIQLDPWSADRSSSTRPRPKRRSSLQFYMNTPSSLNNTDGKNLFNMAVTVVGASTTVVVSGTFFAVLAWKRDALMVSFFIGSIANGILSKLLKKLINETRPAELEESDLKLKPSDNGMPSSHAMSLGFISTFTAICLTQLKWPLAVYCIVSLWYRIQVKLHTWQQVVVGCMAGSFNGYLWHRLCTGDSWGSGIHVMEFVARNFLDETGKLMIPMLIVPVLVGAATVGSVERRLKVWLRRTDDSKSKDE